MKNNILSKIYNKIAASINGNSNRVSSTRIQAYIILFPILIMVAIFLIIEIVAFGNSLYHHIDYHISNEIIIIFGMLLAHHLSILFSRTKSTTASEVEEQINEINNDEIIEESAEK